MISVTPNARSREDRAGDPLDGLVNLFDLGIVLSVAFLLAALSSLHLSGTITRQGLRANPAVDLQIAQAQVDLDLPKFTRMFVDLMSAPSPRANPGVQKH